MNRCEVVIVDRGESSAVLDDQVALPAGEVVEIPQNTIVLVADLGVECPDTFRQQIRVSVQAWVVD